MLPKKRNNPQFCSKAKEKTQECWKCKIVLQIRKSAEKVSPAQSGYWLDSIEP